MTTTPDPFGAPDPFVSGGGGPQMGAGQNAPNAVLSLVLGIIGVVLCSLCAPFAWKFGKEAEAAVDSSGGTLGGRGLATAGKILGIIGTVLLVIAIVVVIVIIAGAAAGS